MIKQKSKQFNTKKHFFILVVIILLQLTRIIYSFAFLKEDYYADEEWSYGLSNSYYEPYIYQDADETRLSHNNEWFSSDILKNYLTVDNEHRFSYGSVFFNQSKDLHPPLYYIILHTICSFFPEKFSFWYGFSINIVVFIILQYFLFKLSNELSDSYLTALITTTMFGFSSGALNMFVFIRMYAMLTMFATLSAYLHTRLIKTENLKRYLPAIFATTLAGALTHHFYLAFGGVLSACFCFYYFFKRKYKNMFVYAVTLLSSVGTSILIFPATINHLFFRRGEITKYTPSWQLKMCFNCVFSELFGFRIKILKSHIPLVIMIVLIVVTILITPLIFLFRNEKWLKIFLNTTKNFIIKTTKTFKNKISTINFMMLFIFLCSISVILLAAATISLIDMGYYTDRYIFIIYPLICVWFIYILKKFFGYIIKNTKISCIFILSITLAISILSNTFYPCIYLFQKESSVQISQISNNSNIIYITDEPWLLTCLTKDVLGSSMIYLSQAEEFKKESSKIMKPNNLNIYLIMDISSFIDEEYDSERFIIEDSMPKLKKQDKLLRREELNKLINQNPTFTDFEYLGKDSVFEREVEVYKLR